LGGGQGDVNGGGRAPACVVRLDALDNSKPAMLQAEDQGILDGVLDAVLADATAVVEEYPDESGKYEVEVADDGRSSRPRSD
jgi:hypothetical protein